MSELEELKATIAKHCAEMRQKCFVAQDALLKSRQAAFRAFDQAIAADAPLDPAEMRAHYESWSNAELDGFSAIATSFERFGAIASIAAEDLRKGAEA
jgi:hypothetical protein